MGRLRDFIREFTRLMETPPGDEDRILADGQALLAQLIAGDDWLPEPFAQPNPSRYLQYLLHCDPLERFSVVSFVCGQGQKTPVHDHTIWGMAGVLRGAEVCEKFDIDPVSGRLVSRGVREVGPGGIERVSPSIGDIHRVANALDDATSISIHVYGANIGAVRRHAYDLDAGIRDSFISGYSSDVMPNIWSLSAESTGVVRTTGGQTCPCS